MTPEERYKRTLRRVQIGGHVLTTIVECYVLAEILWYYTSGGTETFHEALAGYAETLRTRLKNRALIRRTLDMIRDLPEA